MGQVLYSTKPMARRIVARGNRRRSNLVFPAQLSWRVAVRLLDLIFGLITSSASRLRILGHQFYLVGIAGLVVLFAVQMHAGGPLHWFDALPRAARAVVLLTVTVVIPHEVGHKRVSALVGAPGGSLHFAGLVSGWFPEETGWSCLSLPRKMLVYAAGSAANFAVATVCLALEWVGAQSLPPSILMQIELVRHMNLLVGAWELLPVFPLDGGRLLGGFLLLVRFSPRGVRRLLVIATVFICLWRLKALWLGADWFWFGMTAIFSVLSLVAIFIYPFEKDRLVTTGRYVRSRQGRFGA